MFLTTFALPAFAELPVCDPHLQTLMGNRDWIDVKLERPLDDGDGFGLPCQVHFTVDLNTTDVLRAYTERGYNLVTDNSFRFILDLDRFTISPDEVWSFLEVDFDTGPVDLHLVRGSGENGGEFSIVVAANGEGSAAFRTIPLQVSRSRHEIAIHWNRTQGSLTVSVQGGPWGEGWNSASLRVGSLLKTLKVGLLTELDDPIQGSVLGFLPVKYN